MFQRAEKLNATLVWIQQNDHLVKSSVDPPTRLTKSEIEIGRKGLWFERRTNPESTEEGITKT